MASVSRLFQMSDVIERFLRSLVEHDWPAFGACVADDFTRVGPYGDTYSSRADYVAFLSDLMPTLAGYEMQVTRVSYADGVGFAELAETVEVDGELLRTPECLSFDLTDDGRISRVEVFTQTRAPV
jgi:ketosteroid isomerase-like protein